MIQEKKILQINYLDRCSDIGKKPAGRARN